MKRKSVNHSGWTEAIFGGWRSLGAAPSTPSGVALASSNPQSTGDGWRGLHVVSWIHHVLPSPASDFSQRLLWSSKTKAKKDKWAFWLQHHLAGHVEKSGSCYFQTLFRWYWKWMWMQLWQWPSQISVPTIATQSEEEETQRKWPKWKWSKWRQ